MKKLYILLLVLVMLISVVGCTQKETEVPEIETPIVVENDLGGNTAEVIEITPDVTEGELVVEIGGFNVIGQDMTITFPLAGKYEDANLGVTQTLTALAYRDLDTEEVDSLLERTSLGDNYVVRMYDVTMLIDFSETSVPRSEWASYIKPQQAAWVGSKQGPLMVDMDVYSGFEDSLGEVMLDTRESVVNNTEGSVFLFEGKMLVPQVYGSETEVMFEDGEKFPGQYYLIVVPADRPE